MNNANKDTKQHTFAITS